MLDRVAYVAMTGARSAMSQLATTSQNLANASTPGFREAVASYRAVPMGGPASGAGTRAFVVDSTPGAVFAPGSLETTGNPLDLAIDGPGFFAFTRADGSEAYGRGGRFTVDGRGRLTGPEGALVVGERGPITVPRNAQLEIGPDGTVWARTGDNPFAIPAGRMKLVAPQERALSRGSDGLFQLQSGTSQRAPTVKVRQGSLESSNVGVPGAMLQMISQTRLFEMNLKLVQTAEQNSRAANQLLSAARG